MFHILDISKNEEDFLEILEKIYLRFKNEKGITPISDRQYKESSFINYRYGQIKSNNMEEYTGNSNFSLPTGIKDKTGYNPKKFLVDFSFLKMIIESSFGSVFLVKNNENKFIIKDGRNGIGFDSNITSAMMRKHEWEMFKKFDIGVKPIKKVEYLDHNFYVYQYIEVDKLIYFLEPKDVFINHYNNWVLAIENFQKNILSKIDIYDFNPENYLIYQNKIVILDAKFVSPKNKKTWINEFHVGNSLLHQQKIDNSKKLMTIYIFLLLGLKEYNKKMNNKTLSYIYKKNLEKYKLKDPLNISLKFGKKISYKSSYEKVYKKIKVLSIDDVILNWDNKINEKYNSIEIKSKMGTYFSPWLQNGTLNLIYWTIHFLKKGELDKSIYIKKIKESFEYIASAITYKTGKLEGKRGLLYIWNIMPSEIRKNIKFSTKKIKKEIAELESL